MLFTTQCSFIQQHKFATWIVGFIQKPIYPWAYDCMAFGHSHSVTYKASTNHETIIVFIAFSFFQVSSEHFPASGFKMFSIVYISYMYRNLADCDVIYFPSSFIRGSYIHIYIKIYFMVLDQIRTCRCICLLYRYVIQNPEREIKVPSNVHLLVQDVLDAIGNLEPALQWLRSSPRVPSIRPNPWFCCRWWNEYSATEFSSHQTCMPLGQTDCP